ncbi:MAG: Lanthionine biosynthesis protein LanB [Bryobacterales bacterium]|nr:Lanthionine biosynthesis protein LanB [Bryobacterales bacterium]
MLGHIEPVGFFVLRTPLLPMAELVQWGDGLSSASELLAGAERPETADSWSKDVALVRSRVSATLERPEIVHAIAIASESLIAGLQNWEANPDGKKGIQAERAMVRYFARMCGRSTPFGLFSGCSTGAIIAGSQEGVLHLSGRQSYEPVSRLDFEYLFALTTALQSDRVLRNSLTYFPNSSLHQVAGDWHYREARLLPTGRSYFSVKLTNDLFLNCAIARSRQGGTLSDISEAVAALDPDISIEEASEYVRELVSSNVLVSTLVPCVTADPLDDLIEQLEASPASETAKTLVAVRQEMKALDRKGIGFPHEASRISDLLKPLPAKLDPSRLFQVDMVKPAEAKLPQIVVDELVNGLEVLARLSKPAEPPAIRNFREAFVARYDRRAVPLLEALDEEIGVGFGEPSGDASPLTKGLRLDSGRQNAQAGADGSIQQLVARRLMEAAPDESLKEITLDVSTLPVNAEWISALADTFSINATLIAEDMACVARGNFELRIRSIVGPGAGRMLGRFCHADEALCSNLRELHRLESELNTDAVFAEIVHLPEGRIGNILCRPVLRDHEIVYLGRSGAGAEHQIQMDDLVVSVQGSRIVIHSLKLGRQVIPRLTSAHGFVNASLSSVYRFLCMLQHQHGLSAPSASVDFEAFDYLPRIRVGKIILALARWRIHGDDLEALKTTTGFGAFALMQQLRLEKSLPRWVCFEESDNSLPIDLDNPLSVDSLLQLIKRRGPIVLREMYPCIDRLCVSGPEGRYHHELNVPMRRVPVSAPDNVAIIGRAPSFAPRSERCKPVAGDWLYLKVYGGPSVLDELLAHTLYPVITEASRLGSFDRWFFLRYADPEYHLRLRFHGHPTHLLAEVLPQLMQALNEPLGIGKIWRVQTDTYERELERYGGPEGTNIAEYSFCGDSTAVLDILSGMNDFPGTDLRWKIGVLGIDALLSDFGLDHNGKLALCQKLRPRVSVSRALADRYRTYRKHIYELLVPGSEIESEDIVLARRAFARRSLINRSAASRLQSLRERGDCSVQESDLMASYIHMHLNRLIRSGANQHEALLYDFLARTYESMTARMR